MAAGATLVTPAPASDPTTARECTQRISEFHDDEATYQCLAAATGEALTTSGQWEPRCDRHSIGYGYPADRMRPFPTAPAVPQVNDELREAFNDDWWTALFLATSDAVDRVPYAAASEYPVPHVDAFRKAAEPFLRRLLAADAAVKRVRELTMRASSRGIPLVGVDDLRRALDADA